MSRFYLGIFILLSVLILGLWVSHTLDDIHIEISDMLETAAASALSGDLENANALAQTAKSKWETSWHGTAAAADHEPMDEIDGLLSQLDCFARAGNISDFAACCTRCSLLVRAVSEAHSPTWWNLL